MKSRTLQIAGVLALLTVVGKFYAVPVLAQVRATIVQDRDQEGRNIYQYYSNCTGSQGTCTITFPTVPTGEQLIVKHVSLISQLPAATTLNVIQLRGSGTYQFLHSALVPANYSTQYTFVTNEDVLASFSAGQTPAIDTFSTSGASFTALATISGYTIQIP